jgi:hypothetical protein
MAYQSFLNVYTNLTFHIPFSFVIMKNCCNGAFVAPNAAFKICDMECGVNFSFQLLDITVVKVNIL